MGWRPGLSGNGQGQEVMTSELCNSRRSHSSSVKYIALGWSAAPFLSKCFVSWAANCFRQPRSTKEVVHLPNIVLIPVYIQLQQLSVHVNHTQWLLLPIVFSFNFNLIFLSSKLGLFSKLLLWLQGHCLFFCSVYINDISSLPLNSHSQTSDFRLL